MSRDPTRSMTLRIDRRREIRWVAWTPPVWYPTEIGSRGASRPCGHDLPILDGDNIYIQQCYGSNHPNLSIHTPVNTCMYN